MRNGCLARKVRGQLTVPLVQCIMLGTTIMTRLMHMIDFTNITATTPSWKAPQLAPLRCLRLPGLDSPHGLHNRQVNPPARAATACAHARKRRMRMAVPRDAAGRRGETEAQPTATTTGVGWRPHDRRRNLHTPTARIWPSHPWAILLDSDVMYDPHRVQYTTHRWPRPTTAAQRTWLAAAAPIRCTRAGICTWLGQERPSPRSCATHVVLATPRPGRDLDEGVCCTDRHRRGRR